MGSLLLLVYQGKLATPDLTLEQSNQLLWVCGFQSVILSCICYLFRISIPLSTVAAFLEFGYGINCQCGVEVYWVNFRRWSCMSQLWKLPRSLQRNYVGYALCFNRNQLFAKPLYGLNRRHNSCRFETSGFTTDYISFVLGNRLVLGEVDYNP